ncbi:NAD(P)/FAD-dependent oxidoreductase [Chitinophagales bacterium]|nr:NAD(P)/FAD-dependent oxidoreductase [Chitinophagales bacterium]
MSTILQLKLTPKEASEATSIREAVAQILQLPVNSIAHIELLRKSMDARGRNIIINLKVEVFLEGEEIKRNTDLFKLQKQHESTCHIIGLGPAGIYAALQCLEQGIKPIIFERGKPVNERIHDIAAINKQRLIHPESNYCYGEGGAGTYSDGKLYTRSTKRGNVKKVLDTFVQHGADDKIAYEAQPHIGTNKLPKIIARMRQTILDHGGEIYFGKKLSDIIVKDGQIKTLVCEDGSEHPCEQVILATGHSARDIFYLLQKRDILIEAKPFALGVRIEHSQKLIDSIQYNKPERGKYLPPASYKLVTQACGRGVFSFCMCPGGVIASASTGQNETVVNGWSSSARNGPYSNSGLVVEVKPQNWQTYASAGALAALKFQEEIEQLAFNATGSIQAPAQRVEDFIQNRVSSTLPRTSYQPGITSRDLSEILPSFITESMRDGLVEFGRKMKGYRTNNAILVGVESRTSSPVRIPRDKETLQHPQISNLYPCGEGAGYAGGIVSAAIDGMRCAEALQIRSSEKLTQA